MPSAAELAEGAVFVANYELADRFTAMSEFIGVVLDESSILKHKECKTGAFLVDKCKGVPYKLALSATPCPNDFSELLRQAEFMGVATYDFLVGRFFEKQTNQKVVLRASAQRPFVEWLSTWSVWLDCPSDLGFYDDAARFELPPLDLEYVSVSSSSTSTGTSLTNRIKARRLTMMDRVNKAASLVNSDPDQLSPWVLWANLNDEAKALAKAIPGSVELSGTDSPDKKQKILRAFACGSIRVLITKSLIAGFGLNWQHCHRQIFVGLTDSYELQHQAIRRLWRFGQAHPVKCVLLTTDAEQCVHDNIMRKQAEVDFIRELMRQRMKTLWDAEHGFKGVTGDAMHLDKGLDACTFPVKQLPSGATLINGDCVPAMASMGECTVDYAIFSPPFASLYRYSDDPQDLSNCGSEAEFLQHMMFVGKQLYRVLKPGRLITFHIMNGIHTKSVYGFGSLRDLRGEITRALEQAGFLLHSEVCVYRCPVEAMYRTKAPGLFYKQFIADAAICRQSLPDYLVTMSKPGNNQVPITHNPDEHDLKHWKTLASCVWHVRHNDVINIKRQLKAQQGMEDENESVASRGDADASDPEHSLVTKHPTPLQLELIRRCVGLWTNKGEHVLCPFSGIGSVGSVCKELGRSFTGTEINPAYWEASACLV